MSAVSLLYLTSSADSASTSRRQSYVLISRQTLISAASFLVLDSVFGGRHTHPVSVGIQPVTIRIPRDNSMGKPIARLCDSTPKQT